ncbi:hypothetical protein FSPOR_4194 [Fusarium sporotrichioides]|uniref:Protein kinase domain-containing protein n=1 Tax=Fusarium sporotrichioides TaxID=5514 RepID=A0A395SDE0_FUSSP|nr:hypothetical protein FSPOR_4194 [Fusarium sporotrichioides]
MADPLSVAASIAGLISITVEAAKFLKPYVSAAKETPPVAAHVYSEVQSIEIILSGLQNATNSLSSGHARSAALIGVNQVVTVLTDGVLLFSDLQDELRSLSPKIQNEEIPIRTRLRWARKESTFTALLTRLQGFKSSMTLVLMILKSDSDRSATQHHEQLSANINLLLESNHSLSRRLMNLEDSLDARTIASRRMSFLSVTGTITQRTGSERPQPSTADTSSTIGMSKFDFEDDLEASRAYRRAKRDTMDFSFRSSIARSNSWSVFSGLSLGDISIMSVIALPVYQEDLTNAQHYDFGNDRIVVLEDPQPATQRPLLVECLEILQKMRQLPGIEEYFNDANGCDDTFHALWALLRHGYPLTILREALDSRIDIDSDEVVNFLIPLIRWDRRDGFFPPKASISQFVNFLEKEMSRLFTVADLAGSSRERFFKVISVVSLLVERLTAAGIVSNNYSSNAYLQFELHSDTTEAIEEFLAEQRHLVHQMMELAAIKTQLEGDVLPSDDVAYAFGRVEDLINFHIALLIKMERNLFLPQVDNRWHPVFELYFAEVQVEALFIANEGPARSKIRSWLDQGRFNGDERSTSLLTQYLKILPLPGQRMSKYLSFLEYLGSQEDLSTAQMKDIIMAKGSLQQAETNIAEALRNQENREVMRDLLRRVEDWRGHDFEHFGNLILSDSLNVTKDNVLQLNITDITTGAEAAYLLRDYDDILCVGESYTHPGTYCARSVAPRGVFNDIDTIIPRVRKLLAIVSTTPNSAVYHDLHNLATLCLCEHHRYQADKITYEWKEALYNTRRQVNFSSGTSRTSTITGTEVQRLQQSVASLKRDLAGERTAVELITKRSKDKETNFLENISTLERNYKSSKQEAEVAHQTSTNKIYSLKAKIWSLERLSQRHQRELLAQRQSVLQLRTTKTKLQADAQRSATQLEALRAERIGANDEVQLLKTKLEQSNVQNQTLQTEKVEANNEIESLQEELQSLKIKMSGLEKSNKSMVVELAAKNIALGGEETRVKELMKVISNLEISEANLKQVQGLLLGYGGAYNDRIGVREKPIDARMLAAKQLLQGLQALHEGEIVHCDLNSANVMFGLYPRNSQDTATKYQYIGHPRKMMLPYVRWKPCELVMPMTPQKELIMDDVRFEDFGMTIGTVPWSYWDNNITCSG